ncbi:MAG: phosphatidylglycerophosphatase A [Deltaproteobacteria bacterium]|jgi:phosphatidylglycerophosphatase A|nr:phosphatidylglycerophosphatase A [Deltaproteobacteria bacterium]
MEEPISLNKADSPAEAEKEPEALASTALTNDKPDSLGLDSSGSQPQEEEPAPKEEEPAPLTPKESASFITRAARQIYTAGGLGLMPVAPGTWGTIMGVPLYFLFASALGHWSYYLVGTLVVFLIGWWASSVGEKDFPEHDDKRIVVDEVFGYLVTMFPNPFPLPWWGFVVGFVLFRFFDIFKFGPVKKVDRDVPGALGVMLDDGVAGVFAWVALTLLGLLYPLLSKFFAN